MLASLPPVCSKSPLATDCHAQAALVESNAVGTYEVTHSFVVSYVEIYMERVQDLLVEVRTSRSICCFAHRVKERIHSFRTTPSRVDL